MKRRILVSFVAALIGLVPAMNTSEAQSQTNTAKPPTLMTVVGADWHTCGDWKSWSDNFKLGYAAGHAEGVSQVMSFLSDNPQSYTKIKEGFSSTYGLTFGELNKAVDEFCNDYRNVKIPIVNAMMLASGSIAGLPSYDEKTMRFWRCVAAAGNDQSKIRECSSQP